ncbi:hypothetical protein U1Q18_028371, partial [Sarracenia purpurea var. burkii]
KFKVMLGKERRPEEENKKELQNVAYLQETVAKEMEQINLEMQKLDTDRREINLDREQRDNEWAELKIFLVDVRLYFWF